MFNICRHIILAYLHMMACASATAVPEHAPAPTQKDTSMRRSPDAIEALQIDGVWVFVGPVPGSVGERASMLALHSGNASVIDGCLLVGDMIVVWQHDRVDEATQAVAAAKQSGAEIFQFGGGGFSLDEGSELSDFPAAVRSRCPAARGLWLQSWE